MILQVCRSLRNHWAVKNSSILLVAQAVSLLTTIVISALIVRGLGDISFGKYAYGISLATIVGFFTDLGLKELVQREVARDRSRAAAYLGNSLLIKAVLSVIVLCISVALITSLEDDRETVLTAIFCSVQLIIFSINHSFSLIFRAFEKMGLEALTTIANRLLLLSGCSVLIWFGFGIVPIVIFFSLINLAMLGVAFVVCRKRIVRPRMRLNLGLSKRLLGASAPFFLSMMFLAVYPQIGVIILKHVHSAQEVAWYSMGARFLGLQFLIPTAIGGAIFPRLSHYFTVPDQQIGGLIKKTLSFTAVVALVIGSILFAFSNQITSLVFGSGDHHGPAAAVLRLCAGVLLFTYMNVITRTILGAVDKQWHFVIFAGTCFGANILLNIFLIPKLGYMGPAMSLLVSEMCLFGLTIYAIQRTLVHRKSKQALALGQIRC